MRIRRVLVVGAGIAGSTLAYWLARYGMDTKVVERAATQRSSGSPVDVRGPALPVIKYMDLLTPLREAATQASSLTVVDGSGDRIGWLPTQADRDAFEIPRSDLAAILNRAANDHVEYLYEDSVLALHDDGHGVDVTFERSAPRRFDLVIGADGLHSRVRRLVFGPESRFVAHLGLYIATTTTEETIAERNTVLLHNTPGRAVALHPAAGREIAAFIFRAPHRVNSSQDPRHAKRLVLDAYTGMGWKVPELLDRVRNSEDLYVDAVSRVRLDSWSRGRTVLVGDAASCVSLLGDGSSMAIAGAATLAREIGAGSIDTTAALRCYEHAHRKRLVARQRGVTIASHFLVPATRTEIAVRNAAFRLWPRIAATRGTRTIG